MLAPPPDEPSPLRKKAIVFTLLAVLILGGGLIAAKIALSRAMRLRAERQPAAQVEPAKPVAPADSFAAQAFRVLPVTLEQGPGSSLVYVVGTIQNVTNRQRFGVTIELELFDADGSKVGGATDYQKVIEPNAEWKFRALAVDKRARTARVVALKEAQ